MKEDAITELVYRSIPYLTLVFFIFIAFLIASTATNF